MFAGLELRPGIAAIARDVQAAAGAAAGQLPRLAARLPQAGEQDPRVGRVDGDVAGAGVGVLGEHLLPGLAAVGGAIDAAFLARPERRAEHGGEGDVGIGRMDDDRADLADLLPDVLPGLAGVGGLVDAVADGDVAADVGLAGADVDDVRVRRGDGDGADGRGRLVVEDRPEGQPAVGGLPDAAGGGGGVVGERIAGHAADAADAAAGRRADAAGFQFLERRRGFPFVLVRRVGVTGGILSAAPRDEYGEEHVVVHGGVWVATRIQPVRGRLGRWTVKDGIVFPSFVTGSGLADASSR